MRDLNLSRPHVHEDRALLKPGERQGRCNCNDPNKDDSKLII